LAQTHPVTPVFAPQTLGSSRLAKIRFNQNNTFPRFLSQYAGQAAGSDSLSFFSRGARNQNLLQRLTFLPQR
jgi:hypothetical protein